MGTISSSEVNAIFSSGLLMFLWQEHSRVLLMHHRVTARVLHYLKKNITKHDKVQDEWRIGSVDAGNDCEFNKSKIFYV